MVLTHVRMYWHILDLLALDGANQFKRGSRGFYFGPTMFDLQVKSISSAMASCLQEFYKTRPASEGGALDYLQYQFSLPRC